MPVDLKPAPPASIADRPYRLSFTQYRAMAKAGILTENDRIELIEGLMVHKRPKTPAHVLATGLLQD